MQARDLSKVCRYVGTPPIRSPNEPKIVVVSADAVGCFLLLPNGPDAVEFSLNPIGYHWDSCYCWGRAWSDSVSLV
jgi:hypothetical protein